MFVSPIHGEGTAVGQHQHNGLPGRGQGFQQLLLGLRQIKTGTVPAFESVLGHGHLFTLELARDSEHRDDDIGILRRCNRRGVRRRIVLGPDESARGRGPVWFASKPL